MTSAYLVLIWLFFSISNVQSDVLKAQWWPGVEDLSSFSWPEQELFKVRNNLGVAFSGGGFRALLITVGALQQFQAQAVTPKIDYLAAVSGGNWACTVYMYYANLAANDDDLLGTYTPPNLLTDAILASLPPQRLASLGTISNIPQVLSRILKQKNQDPTQVWNQVISQLILNKFLGSSLLPVLNSQHANQILALNPQLSSKLLSPRQPNRPFYIILSSLMGPTELLPISSAKSSLPLPTEWTPLYAGYPLLQQNLSYFSATSSRSMTEVKVGGLVSSFAKLGRIVQTVSNESIVLVNETSLCSIANACGSSSFSYGLNYQTDSVPSSSKNGNKVRGTFGKNIQAGFGPSFSEFQSLTTTGFAEADGYFSSNAPIGNLIARGVKKIIVFVESNIPFVDSSVYNVDQNGYDPRYISSTIPAWFGFDTGNYFQKSSWFFENKEFSGFVKNLQSNFEQGKSAFARQNLTTVGNTYYGIQPGQTVDLACFLMSYSGNFFQKLPSKIQKQISQNGKGPYPNFPYFSKIQVLGKNQPPTYRDINLNSRQSNILVALQSFIVLDNWASISDMF